MPTSMITSVLLVKPIATSTIGVVLTPRAKVYPLLDNLGTSSFKLTVRIHTAPKVILIVFAKRSTNESIFTSRFALFVTFIASATSSSVNW